MVDYEMDKSAVSFWSIDRLLAEHSNCNTNGIWFAEFLISSWGFVYRRIESGIVVIGSDADPELALPSFRAFLDCYLNDLELLGLFVL